MVDDFNNKQILLKGTLDILSDYCLLSTVQCFLKGFSLSLISFMKWVLSTVITIISFSAIFLTKAIF